MAPRQGPGRVRGPRRGREAPRSSPAPEPSGRGTRWRSAPARWRRSPARRARPARSRLARPPLAGRRLSKSREGGTSQGRRLQRHRSPPDVCVPWRRADVAGRMQRPSRRPARGSPTAPSNAVERSATRIRLRTLRPTAVSPGTPPRSGDRVSWRLAAAAPRASPDGSPTSCQRWLAAAGRCGAAAARFPRPDGRARGGGRTRPRRGRRARRPGSRDSGRCASRRRPTRRPACPRLWPASGRGARAASPPRRPGDGRLGMRAGRSRSVRSSRGRRPARRALGPARLR